MISFPNLHDGQSGGDKEREIIIVIVRSKRGRRSFAAAVDLRTIRGRRILHYDTAARDGKTRENRRSYYYYCNYRYRFYDCDSVRCSGFNSDVCFLIAFPKIGTLRIAFVIGFRRDLRPTNFAPYDAEKHDFHFAILF